MVKVIQQTICNNIHIIVESPPQHCSFCICSICASLLKLSCSFYFYLLLVSLFFLFKSQLFYCLKSKIVELVTNIDENCRNVCFEGKVLNRYGIFDYLCSSNANRSSCLSIILIYIDIANNFSRGHFTSKVIFQFVKLDIIVFDFVVSV